MAEFTDQLTDERRIKLARLIDGLPARPTDRYIAGNRTAPADD